MLNISGLKKEYGDFRLDCTMEVKKGRVTGLVGENGAGKSTTFRAVLGLIGYGEGKISLMGKDVRQMESKEKEKIGVVLADSGFGGYMKISDVISVMRSMYPQFEEEKFRSLCKKLGIPEKKMLKDFSTGMKAKLKCIAAITHKAEFLVLDEPTAGLDVMAREQLMDLLREYMEEEEDRSILISSHISSDLEGICDDIYMIHDGKIILHEETDVLISDYGLLKMTEEQFEKTEKKYVLSVRDTFGGKECLTDQKQFYRENYPEITVENCGIDKVILLMIGGKAV